MSPLRRQLSNMARAILIFFFLLTAAADGLQWREISTGRLAQVRPSNGDARLTLLQGDAAGLVFTNRLAEREAAQNQVRMNGSGVALGDFDNDGWCDIYLCALSGENALFLNLGNGRFTNIATQAGVTCPDEESSGAVFADVDGDVDLDLLVSAIGKGVRLFLNDDGTFRDAPGSGLFRRFAATTMALADLEGDGDLDLYVATYRTSTIRSTGFALVNQGGRKMLRLEDRDSLELLPDGRVLEHGEPDILYLCKEPGVFDSVTWGSGRFTDAEGSTLRSVPRGLGLAAMFRDFNGDGAPDLYVCNDFHSPDGIWLNDGKGRLQSASALAVRLTSTFSMSVDVADVNRDGFDDIFVADMLGRTHSRRMMQISASDSYHSEPGLIASRPQVDRNTLQVSRGDGTYAEVANFVGLEASDWT